MKHTLGPWMKEIEHIVSRDENGYCRNDSNSICVLYGPDAEANAHLIAAAPDLLEACNLIDFIPEGWEMPLGWNQIAAQIRKAIAKAEGREEK